MNNCYFIYGEQESKPMPRGWAKNISDFSRLNSSQFNTRLVTLKTCRDEHGDLFRLSKIFWAQVMRFQFIYENGGLYSDCDIEFYGPVPDVSECDYVFATEIHGHVSDAFFYAKPGSSIIKKALDLSLDWCYGILNSKVSSVTTLEFLERAGVGMFSKLVRRETPHDFTGNKQVHMSQAEFAGRFHPEDGVGIVPFEALCRHSRHNWIGWHQCNGTWRPRSDDKVDMNINSLIKLNR
jgi:hypothetical protein